MKLIANQDGVTEIQSLTERTKMLNKIDKTEVFKSWDIRQEKTVIFLVMEKKKNLIKPYDCLTHHLESVQTIVKRAATPAEPRSFLVLRTYRQVFREAELTRVCRSGYWRKQNCTEREFRGLQSPLESLSEYKSVHAGEETTSGQGKNHSQSLE